ncbi:4'-phosphopantetheinyl transferase family protein [Actinoalloteichus hymeniacidonis]|uniref:Phosphopantetheinyl transferase component of siderophore synthetase n=1 Tax=Actinoalloteichus hymeniacidonis TaxID=340345 RepID=A0AAC9HQK8_9PSEU|nr:4'-phosphopantetheinyl transferase superfamily protein [Actinoalloteichus hymeniacidonis]AOS63558.1 phosphopantetheinyl transferase component of siderophore synthetase [Actinoalloteichus hymeniacidonis]MBB5908396.1 4'-phosphopantetheinyl transferase EntD [Actinoalloteichus hymeniacidonis]
MIKQILPSEVVAVDVREDPPEATLFPEEEALVAAAVEKRRREFRTVRHCARLALAELDVPPSPLLRGERGAPIWPAGIVGSMTHCAGYRAAAVGRSEVVSTIGIDAEPHDRLPDGVLDAVSLPAERVRHAALAGADATVHWDRILFSAKESVYKAWFPLTGRWLGFEDADITIDAEAGAFQARLLVPGDTAEGLYLTGFAGRWLVQDGVVTTAIAVLR